MTPITLDTMELTVDPMRIPRIELSGPHTFIRQSR